MPSFIATVLYKDEAYYTHSYAQAYDESIKGNGKKATNVTKDDTDIPRELLGPKYRAGEQASEAAKPKSLQTREQEPPDHFSHTGSKGLGKGVGRTGDQMNVYLHRPARAAGAQGNGDTGGKGLGKGVGRAGDQMNEIYCINFKNMTNQ